MEKVSFNSTRYIRNAGPEVLYEWSLILLSTPHGTLGTNENGIVTVFNSFFQLHTVH